MEVIKIPEAQIKEVKKIPVKDTAENHIYSFLFCILVILYLKIPKSTNKKVEQKNTASKSKNTFEEKPKKDPATDNFPIQNDGNETNNSSYDLKKTRGKIKRSQIKMKMKDLKILAKSKTIKMTKRIMKFKKISVQDVQGKINNDHTETTKIIKKKREVSTKLLLYYDEINNDHNNYKDKEIFSEEMYSIYETNLKQHIISEHKHITSDELSNSRIDKKVELIKDSEEMDYDPIVMEMYNIDIENKNETNLKQHVTSEPPDDLSNSGYDKKVELIKNYKKWSIKWKRRNLRKILQFR